MVTYIFVLFDTHGTIFSFNFLYINLLHSISWGSYITPFQGFSILSCIICTLFTFSHIFLSSSHTLHIPVVIFSYWPLLTLLLYTLIIHYLMIHTFHFTITRDFFLHYTCLVHMFFSFIFWVFSILHHLTIYLGHTIFFIFTAKSHT